MHLLLTERGSEPFLIEELRRAFPGAEHRVLSPGLVTSDFLLQGEAPPVLVFCQQLLPSVRAARAPSITAWAQLIFTELGVLRDDASWQVHLVPFYGSGTAGQNRCRLIRESLCDLLQRRHRLLLKALLAAPAVFTLDQSLVQLLLTSPDSGFISVATAPIPHQQRRVISPFPRGEIPIAGDKAAPSRAFAKLVEAEQRLGRRIQPGDGCVDLGAAPGSWSYVALHRGARVTAVDRALLRSDLMAHPNLVFQQGDAFTFRPQAPVDWLLCDVIAAPERTMDLLLRWLREKRCRRFVATIKFKGTEDYGILERLKHALPSLCTDSYLTRLTANKNEVCTFGQTVDAEF
jgi:23S rRNA (cytidine2498-2'-O)-methyltransferase